MKTIKSMFLAALLGAFFMSNSVFAQSEKEYFYTCTKMHWNMNLENFSMDEWKATEKEYLDKVVKKNELIVGQEVLMHFFTADNTEILFVYAYESWDVIEKAGARTTELEKLAWPDEKVRKAFLDKRKNYYAHNHSDEIYASFPGAKIAKTAFSTPVLFYIRETVFAYPKEGTNTEFLDYHKQYVNAVINKNDLIKAYYPNVHAWGADNTNFTEVFVVESLCDLEKALDKNGELFKATWNDKAKQESFSKVMDKYYTGVHRDYIYRLVPELTK